MKKYLMLLLLACCVESTEQPAQKKFNYEIVVLSYPQRTLKCEDYGYLQDCGLTFFGCVEKDTEEFYDSIRCVSAMIKKVK